MIRGKVAGTVNVDMKAVEGIDMARVLTNLRAEYETIMQKNRRGVEEWYTKQVSGEQEHTHTHTHTHTDTPTLTYTQSHSHSHTHTHTHPHSNPHSLTHSHTLTLLYVT